MNTLEFITAAKNGKSHYKTWSLDNKVSDMPFNLSEITIHDATFHGDVIGEDLKDANFTNAKLSHVRFERIFLGDVDFAGAELNNCVFSQCSGVLANFTSAKLNFCNFYFSFQHLIFKKSVCRHLILSVNSSIKTLTPRTQLVVDFSEAVFYYSEFDCLFFEGNLGIVSFIRCAFKNVHFNNLNFGRAQFAEVTFEHVDINQATNLRLAKGISEISPCNSESPAVNFFENCQRSWPEKFVSWESLRIFGKLPLFGISYGTLVSIPTYCYFVSWYNRDVDFAKKVANAVAADSSLIKAELQSVDGKLPAKPAESRKPTAYQTTYQVTDAKITEINLAIQSVPHAEMPALMFALLCGTVFLAIASTLYLLACPSRIKEFTRSIWCDQFKRPLIQYWPLTWKWRWIRLACGSFYLSGGLIVLFVFVNKIFNASIFIWKYSYHS